MTVISVLITLLSNVSIEIERENSIVESMVQKVFVRNWMRLGSLKGP